MEENLPSFLRKRIGPDEAAAAVVRGIEERAPRIFAPRWWRYVSALRGILNPLLDRRFEARRGDGATTASEATDGGAAAIDARRPPRSSASRQRVSRSSRKTNDS